MALHFTIQINGQPIGAVAVQRREHLDLSDPAAIADAVSTYDVSSHVLGTNETRTAVVRHRYGDGSLELARRALNAVVDHDDVVDVRRLVN